ncbi:MAG: response regulator [Terracidiphilus sp.]|jgi:CheY-like chemotaxis protein
MSRVNRRTAFVVDDENIIASTLELILISEGFNARSFVDPLDALNAAQSVSPDLLLTDVIMPNINGIELAIQIRQLCPDCKILLSSGQVMTNDLLVAAGLQGHHFEVLAKPVHPRDLLETIERLFKVQDTESN